MKLVSIIIPVYNVSIDYLRICLDSVINQTYQELEILLVDDGSDAIVAQFCDSCEKIDYRIRVFHKSNGGVSSARNYAIERSNGVYLMFVDSDDWLELDFVKTLVEALERTKAQMAIADMVYEKGKSLYMQTLKKADETLYTRSQMYHQILCSTKIGGFLWNKIFIKSLVTHRLNEAYHYCEDLVFTAKYLSQLESAVFIDVKLYHYRQGGQNASSDYTFNEKVLTLLDAYRELECIYAQEYPEDLLVIRKNILKQALNFRARYKISKLYNPKQCAKFISILQEYWYVVTEVPVSEKLNIYLTKWFPIVMFKLKNLLKKKLL